MKMKLIKLTDGQWVNPEDVNAVLVLPIRDGQPPRVIVKTADGCVINVVTEAGNQVATAERISRAVNEAISSASKPKSR